MATKNTGLNNLTEEQVETIKKIFAEENNKTKAWENAKEAIPGLNGSYSFAKNELVEIGIVSDIESLGFTSVEQYREYAAEQDALPVNERDKQMATQKRCPLPVDGVYTDVKDFGKKATYDRKQLLKKANDVASETKKSSLPYIYKHGFAMTYEQLATLMEAYGFSMDSRTEYFTDEKGKTRTKTVSFFVDSMPPAKAITAQVEDVKEYNLDQKRNKGPCFKMTVSKETGDAMDKLLERLKEGVRFTKARTSTLYELIFASGIASVQEKFDKGELKLLFEQRTISFEKSTFSKEKQKTDEMQKGGK